MVKQTGYIFQDEIRRVSGLNQSGNFKEQSSSGVTKAPSCPGHAETLARKSAAEKLEVRHGAGVGFSGIFNEPLSLRVKQGVVTAVGVFVDFAVSYAFKSSGTGQSFAETADAGEHIYELDQGHNSLCCIRIATKPFFIITGITANRLLLFSCTYRGFMGILLLFSFILFSTPYYIKKTGREIHL